MNTLPAKNRWDKMKNFTQKKRLANIIIWAAAIPFFFLYRGLSSFADTYGKKITVTCISMLLCAALLCWTIIYSLFLKKENTDKRLPWESWFLYSGLWFIFFALNLTGVFVLFQLQKTFVCGIFIALGLACLFARLVFNFISKTEFFNTTEENIALFIALLLAAFTIAAYFQPSFIAEFFAILFMGCISVLLMALMIKKFVVEQIKFISLESILDFIFLFLATIATSVATIYFIFWKPGAESQDLFNAVMGIFAGLVGGALTLAGVAWTIKKSDKDKREEELQKAKPLFSLLSAIDFDTVQKFEVKKDFTEIDVKLNNVTEINYPKVVFWGAFLNSDCSNFTIEEIYIGRGKTVRPYSQNAIIKNQKFLLVMQSFLWNTQIEFIIILQDTFNRLFYYKLGIVDECVPNIPEKIMKIINFTEISENEFEEIKRKDKITNND